MPQSEQTDTLFKVTSIEYGESYSRDYLSMYQSYVSSAHSISERRNAANTFFLTANTALLGLTGYLSRDAQSMIWLAALAAVVFSIAWLNLISAYASLNKAKFSVITQLEQRLPIAPYEAEWAETKRSATPHHTLTRAESWVPKIFIALHFAVFSFSIWAWLGL